MKFLFLHGLIAFPSDWDPVIEAIARIGPHRCEAPGVPYLTGDVCDPEEIARQVVDGLAKGYIDEDCVIVGHSIGCTLALCLADRAAHIFLLAPHTKFRTQAIPRGEQDMRVELDGLVHDPDSFSEEIRRTHMDLWHGVLRSRDRIRHLKNMKDAMARFDHEAYYDRHAGKISFVLGKQDRISRLADFAHLRGRPDRLRFIEIDRCCHAVPLEHPELVANLLLDVPITA